MDWILTLIILTNQARPGLPQLQTSAYLQPYAQQLADYECKNLQSGVRPNHEAFYAVRASQVFYKCGKKTCIRKETWGENISWDYPNPEAQQYGLMHSPLHYANIVNQKYKKLAVAKAKSCNLYVYLFSE